jgi:hypothetical protein
MVELKDTSNWRVPKHPALDLWRSIKPLIRLSFLIALALFLYARHYSIVLPKPSTLRSELGTPPEQTSTSTPSFNFEWKGTKFVVHPQADYHAAGLVLTHNNTGGIGDIYHDANSVDLKDICIVWGESASSGAYLSGTFHSEPWTCVYTQNKGADPIYNDEFSNNHLLAGTEEVARKIRATRIGDQVQFSGFLVNYAPEALPDNLRQTSLVRSDTGNGACEVVFVTNYEILSSANKKWRRIEHVSWLSMLGLGAMLILSVTLLPYLEYRLE